MNVIMPTAMSSLHTDSELRECASKTADNGKKILRLIRHDNDVVSNCKAISSVCTGETDGGDEVLTKVWKPVVILVLKSNCNSFHTILYPLYPQHSTGGSSLTTTNTATSRGRELQRLLQSFAESITVDTEMDVWHCQSLFKMHTKPKQWLC